MIFPKNIKILGRLSNKITIQKTISVIKVLLTNLLSISETLSKNHQKGLKNNTTAIAKPVIPINAKRSPS